MSSLTPPLSPSSTRTSDLSDWDSTTFVDGSLPTWSSAAGKFVGDRDTPPTSLVHGLNTIGSGIALVKCNLVRVQMDGSFRRGRALGTSDAVRRMVGLCYDDEIPDGQVGRVQYAGPLTATTTQWDVVTGQTGGLTPGRLYYASTDFGLITLTPRQDPGDWIYEVGVSLTPTTMLIRTHTRIQA